MSAEELAPPLDGDWLRDAHAVVLPAHVEHAPRVLLRALAAGGPVIATPACGIAPQGGLVLVEPGDVDALRAAIWEAVSCA